MKYEILINGAKRSVELNFTPMAARIDGRTIDVDVAAISSSAYSILLEGRAFEATVERDGDGWLLHTAGREFHIKIDGPRSWRRRHGGSIEMEGRQQIIAPMPGKIVRLLAAPGQKVESGQGLLVIEAMKMQNEVRSPKSGIVERLAREGQTVNAGEILAVVG